MRAEVRTQRVTCTECNGTGAKSSCCCANVTKSLFTYICRWCKEKCKTVNCLICKGKGYVNLKVD